MSWVMETSKYCKHSGVDIYWNLLHLLHYFAYLTKNLKIYFFSLFLRKNLWAQIFGHTSKVLHARPCPIGIRQASCLDLKLRLRKAVPTKKNRILEVLLRPYSAKIKGRISKIQQMIHTAGLSVRVNCTSSKTFVWFVSWKCSHSIFYRNMKPGTLWAK